MSTNETKQYFDLHTNGFGYLNRIREVTLKEGASFLSVTVAALRGSVDNAQYTHFECRVSGRQAQGNGAPAHAGRRGQIEGIDRLHAQ